MPYHFLIKAWMKKAKDFKIAELQPVGVALLLLDLLPISILKKCYFIKKAGVGLRVRRIQEKVFRQ